MDHVAVFVVRCVGRLRSSSLSGPSRGVGGASIGKEGPRCGVLATIRMVSSDGRGGILRVSLLGLDLRPIFPGVCEDALWRSCPFSQRCRLDVGPYSDHRNIGALPCGRFQLLLGFPSLVIVRWMRIYWAGRWCVSACRWCRGRRRGLYGPIVALLCMRVIPRIGVRRPFESIPACGQFVCLVSRCRSTVQGPICGGL